MLGPRNAFTSRHFRENSNPATGITKRVYRRHSANVNGDVGDAELESGKTTARPQHPRQLADGSGGVVDVAQ